MDSIGGFTSALGEAFRDLMQTIFGAISGFVDRISLWFNSVYAYIPRPYVIGGLTILVLGIILMALISRPRRD